MVFARDGDIFVAKEDGSGAQKLADGRGPKSRPSWSPDGQRVFWLTPGERDKDPKMHALIVIASESGKILHEVPVYATEPDGDEIMGMRFVEWAGWYSNLSVYAAGSINPWHSEYSAMEASSGRVIRTYDGSDFSTCPERSLVADYSLGMDPQESQSHIEVNWKRVYPKIGWLGFREIESDLLWSPDCSHLALLRRHAGKSLFLVVLQGDVLEAELEIPEAQRKIKEFVALPDGYVVSTTQGVLYYKFGSKTLRPATQTDSLVTKTLETLGRRLSIRNALQAESADWWPKINRSDYLSDVGAR
jgi:hypothetical protein